ncbi:MAG: hypothetical protein H0W83_07660 [Planctomycetes bacterium]|nr:hypothetical protein [Planctomycetota bacterium]
MRKWFTSMTPEGHDPEVFPIADVNEQLAKGLDLLAKEFAAAEDGAWGDMMGDGPDDPKVIEFPRPQQN